MKSGSENLKLICDGYLRPRMVVFYSIILTYLFLSNLPDSINAKSTITPQVQTAKAVASLIESWFSIPVSNKFGVQN